jgi:peptide/nickel transport system ATP-binding protein
MEPLLDVRNLKVEFKIDRKWVPAVEDVHFQLKAGETLTIVGESGCGKSVTAMSMLRLLPKTTAQISADAIMFRGRDISQLSDVEMTEVRGQGIGMIFQDSMTSLNPVKTVGKQLDEAFLVHGTMEPAEVKQATIHLLREVGISSPEERYKEYPHQLSGGMRQRVMIAMALAQQPAIIIADEPTTALDVTIQAQILELLKKMQEKSGSAIILITHDMGVVAEMADKIIVMYAGMFVECSSAKDLFTNPKHPYTRGLLKAIPRKDMDIERLNVIEGTVPTLTDMPKGCRFYDRCESRMERCKNELPPMYTHGESSVRCFLFDVKDGEGLE